MTEVPGIAREIIDLIERFECTAALARLDEPREGGALPPAIAGILRARALGGVEKFYAAHLVLRDLRAMRDLSAVERIEVQLRSARVFRHASPLVDYALELALAASQAGSRVGGAALGLAVDARIEAALLYARKRCRKLAEAELDAAAALNVHPARIHAGRAEIALQFDERVVAKEAFEKAIDVEPRLGHLGLARLCTILGEFEAAQKHLSLLGTPARGDVGIRRVAYRMLSAQAKWPEVAKVLEEILAIAPEGDYGRGLSLERASALYRAGDLAAARDAWTKIVAGAQDGASKTAARMLDKCAHESGKRTRLSAFPSVAQLRNHCGPASVELCLRFFGAAADQVEVAREIKHPDGGTPVARMRWYMDRAGFVTRRIEASLPKLKAILDAGVPVIIEEDYSTSRHVAVAVGYDDRREILEVQDPMTHEIRETSYEDLPKLREFANDGALVAVPKDRADLLAKLDAAGASECAYITKTDEAWTAKDQKRDDDADRLASEAIALHEAYELAWVFRFTRARERFLDNRSEENHETLTGVLRKILALWPDDEWPQQFLGRVYQIEDRDRDALQAFERARDRDPDDSNNWCSIGDCHLALDDRAEARKAFEAALERDPGHVRANENLANIAFEAGELSLAETLNACAREAASDNPYNHHVHGRILAKKGDPQAAADAYRRALEIDEDSEFYTVSRARHLANASKVDEAIASLEALREKKPESTYLVTNLADLAYEFDRIDACLRACDKLAALSPESPTPKAIGGAAQCKKGKIDEGLALLREALAKQPTYAWAHREMGRALGKAGRPHEAIAAYAAAAGLGPSTLATFNVGDALASGGFPSHAGTYMRRAGSSGELDETQLARVASVIRSVDGAQAAHVFFGNASANHSRDVSLVRAHARFLVEELWAPGPAAGVIAKLSELAPEDPFVLAKEADDLMDASMEAEGRGEAMFKRAIAAAPNLVYPRRLFARQLNQRGRFQEALAILENCKADEETLADRVHAMVGLRRSADASAAIDAYANGFPEDQRGAKRRPLDYKIARVERRFDDALALAVAIAGDEGELEDDGELGRWERERFECLVGLKKLDEAYAFGVAQCADADDRGTLAYAALSDNGMSLAVRLATEALEEDADETTSLHVMARSAELDGDVAKAKEIWTRMQDITTWHIHVENLGRLALGEGDLARGREWLERSVATGHCCPVSLALRAELHVLEGNFDAARIDIKRARDCVVLENRDTSEDVYALAAALEGNKDEARTLYERYATRDRVSDADRARLKKVREVLAV